MKDFLIWLAILAIILIALPWMLIHYFHTDTPEKHNTKTITLYIKSTGKIEKMDLEDYIVGVVSAEMPASFEPEALKAQALAARTYALRKINSNSEQHQGADLCSDYAHCQAYINKTQAKKNWGEKYNVNIKKITNAVRSTAGEYVTYQGEAAITVFHSCCNGMTERAADVWGGDYPYLTNVKSEGDSENPGYTTTVEVSIQDFKAKIKEFSKKEISDESPLIGAIELTAGGNVNRAQLCGISLKGTEIRKIFTLRSAAFTVQNKEDTLIFTVSANGHGVGMSQYGANYMAKQGKNYQNILSHYYPGTEIKNMNNSSRN